MIDQRVYWIWLTGIASIGPVMQKKLLKQFDSPEVIFRINPRELEKVPGMGPALVDRILAARSLDKSERMLERMLKGNIGLLTIEDPLYPEKVKQNPKAPVVLYYRGSIRENSMGVGVVGTRQCTSYGKQVAIETAAFLAKHQIPVISGMAKGIDGYAHTACLKAGGYTMAFLGSGVDVCYPREHQSLMEAIIQKGAILSSYPPGTPIYPHHFHQRNFLISAWSSKLLVVEAGEKSGTWSTVNHARTLKREICS
ncbi:DNA-processing protein DprA [Ammoniphilus resinae]|uniref:DNA protecting protein DprA n=1 Tax=Ammoniphilus resinae TaxID=861532 RepID=A0ABS4GXW2_9BACL|nr:DNA-protecting protein DprA [Ammoniphilus resinae]MBP1935115.1 DNA protecting protein DprA [Ammoniphilus resinae]